MIVAVVVMLGLSRSAARSTSLGMGLLRCFGKFMVPVKKYRTCDHTQTTSTSPGKLDLKVVVMLLLLGYSPLPTVARFV